MSYTYEDMAKMIDHSLLNPALTVADLEAGMQLALAYDVASVCILPYYLPRCAELLKPSRVKASTTIGFPHGGHTTAIKRAEAERLVLAGAVRFDNGWFLRDGTWMSRYVVQRPGDVAIATAQKSLCTCASRHPESLQLVMPSDNCVHFLAARLAEDLAEDALSR